MEIDNKKVFLVMAAIALFLASVVISQSFNAERKLKEQKIRLSQIGKLQFKGKVINSKVYRYANF
jgi:type 1 fimbria pilin